MLSRYHNSKTACQQCYEQATRASVCVFPSGITNALFVVLAFVRLALNVRWFLVLILVFVAVAVAVTVAVVPCRHHQRPAREHEHSEEASEIQYGPCGVYVT